MSKALTWPERIKRARKRGDFTERDRIRASGWNTCAVGETASFAIESSASGAFAHVRPEFSRLDSLGLDFCGLVEVGDVGGAAAIFREIERQAKKDARPR